MPVIILSVLVLVAPLLFHYEAVGTLHLSARAVLLYACYLGVVSLSITRHVKRLRDRRRGAEGELQFLLDTLDCGVVKAMFTRDMKRKILWANEGFYRLTGSTRKQYREHGYCDDPASLLHPDDYPLYHQAYHSHLLQRTNFYLETRAFHRDGHLVWLGMQSVYVGQMDGNPVFLSVMNDITVRKTMEEQARWERKKNQAITQISGEIFFEYNQEQDELHFLGHNELIPGPDLAVIPHFLREKREDLIVHQEDVPLLRGLLEEMLDAQPGEHGKQQQLRMLCQGGGIRWCLGYVSVLVNDEGQKFVLGKLVDIHAIVSRANRLGKLVERDVLTGVFNRMACKKYVDLALQNDVPCSFVLMDIDFFKQFNDNEGHTYGDLVLTTITAVLRKTFRGTDIMGRFGGDEFILFLPGVAPEQTMGILERYMNALYAEGLHTGDRPLTISVGVSFAPRDGRSYDSLFAAADKALYKAKECGRARIATSDPTIPCRSMTPSCPQATSDPAIPCRSSCPQNTNRDEA